MPHTETCRETLAQWTTTNTGTPMVKYGTKSGSYPFKATGASCVAIFTFDDHASLSITLAAKSSGGN